MTDVDLQIEVLEYYGHGEESVLYYISPIVTSRKGVFFWFATTNTLSGGTLFFYPFSKILYLCNCKVHHRH